MMSSEFEMPLASVLRDRMKTQLETAIIITRAHNPGLFRTRIGINNQKYHNVNRHDLVITSFIESTRDYHPRTRTKLDITPQHTTRQQKPACIQLASRKQKDGVYSPQSILESS